jgi:hypothetical protein
MSDDLPQRMNQKHVPRREIWLVALLVVITAVWCRYVWIPGPWREGLQFADDVWRIPVTGVGKWFSAWTVGDGQAFAVIAADPLGLDQGWELSQPAYRYSRAGFGWLAWVVSLGQSAWVPYGMAIVGTVSVVGAFVLAVRLRPELGPSSWLLVLNPAIFIAFAGDTAEALAVLALAFTIASGRWWASVALGVIRPSFLVALVGRWRSLLWGALAATTLGVLWTLRFGLETGQYGGNFAPPYAGYWRAPSLAAIGLAILATVTLLRGVRRRDWGWAASGLLVICFSEFLVENPADGWRTGGMLLVLWAFGPGYEPSPTALVDSPGAISVPA